MPSRSPDTALDRWLRWFGEHSPSWLETLIRPAGIHNFQTAITFSPVERLFLSNGLRFIPSPSSSQTLVFQRDYLECAERGWPRFSRLLLNTLHHEQTDADATADPANPGVATYVSKFTVRSACSLNNTWLREQLRDSRFNDLAVVEAYENRTQAALSRAVTNSDNLALLRQQRLNITREQRTFLQHLLDSSSITIKPADKNLGMVMVDTIWYECELQRMLNDTVTYRPYEIPKAANKPPTRGRPAAAFKTPLDALAACLYPRLIQLAQTHEAALRRWHPQSCDQMLRFLTHSITKDTAALPGIYLLIKVHKPKGLCGRPIVPSTRWITTPASVLADHLLQEILRQAAIPWIVKDTKSFVCELEATRLPHPHGVFVTADIASLYTNIDTEMGLALVLEFLLLQQVPAERIRLIMDLLSFVMRNSYLTFKDVVFHQIDGTAMGTSVAPTYANIVVYMLERRVIAEFGASLYLYRRFLDDVFVYLCPTVVERFKARMNSLHPKLLFDFVDTTNDAAFLDLSIEKGVRFHTDGRFDLRVHQKKMNLYLYIPYRSFHTEAAKRSFIQTELMRYIRNSSDRDAYLRLKGLFWDRLRDRGYPSRFLSTIFDSIFYDDRHYFLLPTAHLAQHPHIRTSLPRSACLLRKLQRQELDFGRSTITGRRSSPPVFMIPYSPLSHVVPTRAILTRHWEYLCTALPLSRPLIAYESLPSLVKMLVYMKAKRETATTLTATSLAIDAAAAEQARPSAAARQTTLTSFVLRSGLPSTAVAAVIRDSQSAPMDLTA
jgi:hypothetical protein